MEVGATALVSTDRTFLSLQKILLDSSSLHDGSPCGYTQSRSKSTQGSNIFKA